MGKGYLIDSNAIIDFFNQSLPEPGKKLLFNIKPIISIITFIEIFSNSGMNEMDKIQLQDFTEIATIHDIDRDVALKAIELRLKYKIKLPDALIAATALRYDLILITRNLSDFAKIEKLRIINPHKI